MDYFDSKVLESFMIPAEEATSNSNFSWFDKIAFKGIYDQLQKEILNSGLKQYHDGNKGTTGSNFDSIRKEYNKIVEAKRELMTKEYHKALEGFPNKFTEVNKDYKDFLYMKKEGKYAAEWDRKFNEAAINDMKNKMKIKYDTKIVVDYFEEKGWRAFSPRRYKYDD